MGHGLSARGSHFALLVAKLRNHFRRIVIPDLLGHGRSYRPADPISGPQMQDAFNDSVNGVLRPDEDVVLYGNSLGGYGVIRYAGTRPERVRAVTVNSPGGGRLRSMRLHEYMNRFRVETPKQTLDFVGPYVAR